MGSMKKIFLGAALAMGALAMTAAPSQAARIGFYVGGRTVAVPACPGPGCVWVGGYWNDGYWTAHYGTSLGFASVARSFAAASSWAVGPGSIAAASTVVVSAVGQCIGAVAGFFRGAFGKHLPLILQPQPAPPSQRTGKSAHTED